MDKLYYCIKVDGSQVLISKVLKPICVEAGITTQTLRNWLKSPETALKRGYFVGSVEILKSSQGIGNSPFQRV
jgi:hypothetical protein